MRCPCSPGRRARAARAGGVLYAGCIAALAAGCASSAGDSSTRQPAGAAVPWDPAALSEPVDPDDNPSTPEKIELGRRLFYDPILSSDRQVACATCHSEIWGMSDALPRSIGVDGSLLAGPGRTGPNETRRNSQTIWNVAYSEHLFWDGRAASLEDQVLFPLNAAGELNRKPEDVVADLAAIEEYQNLFAAAFPDDAAPVTVQNFTRALAAFERSVVSNNALYDAYLAGDQGAFSDEMIAGMFLFAEVGCSDCHTPPLFASDRFEDRAVAPVEGIDDSGRYEVTGNATDIGRFRVPTLRNVRETNPYFHTGAVASLEDAVRHEAEVSRERDGARALDEAELTSLTTFVAKALVDRTREPDRPETVPSGYPVPLDDTRLLR